MSVTNGRKVCTGVLCSGVISARLCEGDWERVNVGSCDAVDSDFGGRFNLWV